MINTGLKQKRANPLALVPASVRTGDPTTRFEEMIARVAVSLDRRLDDELLQDSRELKPILDTFKSEVLYLEILTAADFV